MLVIAFVIGSHRVLCVFVVCIRRNSCFKWRCTRSLWKSVSGHSVLLWAWMRKSFIMTFDLFWLTTTVDLLYWETFQVTVKWEQHWVASLYLATGFLLDMRLFSSSIKLHADAVWTIWPHWLMEICICFVDISGKGGMIVIQWCLYSAEINIYMSYCLFLYQGQNNMPMSSDAFKSCFDYRKNHQFLRCAYFWCMRKPFNSIMFCRVCLSFYVSHVFCCARVMKFTAWCRRDYSKTLDNLYQSVAGMSGLVMSHPFQWWVELNPVSEMLCSVQNTKWGTKDRNQARYSSCKGIQTYDL